MKLYNLLRAMTWYEFLGFKIIETLGNDGLRVKQLVNRLHEDQGCVSMVLKEMLSFGIVVKVGSTYHVDDEILTGLKEASKQFGNGTFERNASNMFDVISARYRKNSSREKIWEFLKDNPNSTIKDVYRATGIEIQTIRRNLNILQNFGWVRSFRDPDDERIIRKYINKDLDEQITQIMSSLNPA